jgi:hypothetical protein
VKTTTMLRVTGFVLWSALAAVPIASADPLPMQTYGSSHGEWSARWWQWVFSLPAATHPILDQTGDHCGAGQVDSVWFLAGTFGGNAERSCTIPPGQPIFFPIVNSAGLKAWGYETLLDLRKLAAVAVDQVEHMSVTIDGVELEEEFLLQQRVRSPAFSVIARAKGVFPPGFTKVPGNADQIVSDGYWLLLEPLEPGAHELHFSAAGPLFSLDVTYHLTVE